MNVYAWVGIAVALALLGLFLWKRSQGTGDTLDKVVNAQGQEVLGPAYN